jgi:predicted aspartyl protease
MPTHNQYFRDQNKQLNSQAMVLAGPVLQVEISVEATLAEYLTAHNQPVPQPIGGWALIDTGATRTAIDQSVVKHLNLSPIDQVVLSTAHGQREAGVYACRMKLVSTALPEITASRATEVDLAGQSVADKTIIALIGRDLLSNCVFVYNGTNGHFSISF